jgi:flagellar FliL protein
MADGDKGIARQLQMAVMLSSVTALVLAIGLVLGIVALKARMTPHKKKPPEVALPGPMMVIKDQIYNLGEANRYLKATIVMELDKENKKDKEMPAFLDEAKKRDPQIRDLVIRLMSGKTFREINSPAGKAQLKEELRKKINAVLSRGEVKQVLFTQFALQ